MHKFLQNFRRQFHPIIAQMKHTTYICVGDEYVSPRESPDKIFQIQMANLQVSDDVNIEYISQFANRNIETDIKNYRKKF